MKIYYILKWVTLILTLIVWLLFICGADSLAEAGYLDLAFVVVAFTTGLCYITVNNDDIRNMFKIDKDETV